MQPKNQNPDQTNKQTDRHVKRNKEKLRASKALLILPGFVTSHGRKGFSIDRRESNQLVTFNQPPVFALQLKT